MKDVPYNVNPNLIELNAGASKLAQAVKAANYKIIVVSNQSGVARGFFAETDLKAVWRKLNELCQVEFDGFYFCPHHESGTIEQYKIRCECRKPSAGMLLQAAREHDLDLSKSWMIGDILHDIEAGNRAGCRTILLDNGGETEWLAGAFRTPDYTIKNLAEAARLIPQHDSDDA